MYRITSQIKIHNITDGIIIPAPIVYYTIFKTCFCTASELYYRCERIAEWFSDDNYRFIIKVESKDLQTILTKGLQHLFYAALRAALVKIKFFFCVALPNCVNSCAVFFFNMFILYNCGRGPRDTTWRAACCPRSAVLIPMIYHLVC